MAFEDYQEDDQNELDADRQRRFLAQLATQRGLPAILGRRTPDGTPQPSAPAANDSAGFFGGSLSPRVPSARNIPLSVPTVEPPGGPSTSPFLGTGSVRPAPPTAYQNYQALLGQEPKRADFDKYKLSTDRKSVV